MQQDLHELADWIIDWCWERTCGAVEGHQPYPSPPASDYFSAYKWIEVVACIRFSTYHYLTLTELVGHSITASSHI